MRSLKMQFQSWKQFNLYSSVTGYQIYFPFPQLELLNYRVILLEFKSNLLKEKHVDAN